MKIVHGLERVIFNIFNITILDLLLPVEIAHHWRRCTHDFRARKVLSSRGGGWGLEYAATGNFQFMSLEMAFPAFFRKEFFQRCGFGKQTFNVFSNCPDFFISPRLSFLHSTKY